MREHRYYVYMMQSTPRHALYIGVTAKITQRVRQHKNHVVEGFTEKYKCDRLVYYEILRPGTARNRPREAVKRLAARKEGRADC
jgi:putative endonuclease